MNSATIRRFKMYKYFRNHSDLYTYKKLAKKYHVSERTIIRDIKFMVAAGWISKKVENGRLSKDEYGGFYIMVK